LLMQRGADGLRSRVQSKTAEIRGWGKKTSSTGAKVNYGLAIHSCESISPDYRDRRKVRTFGERKA